MSYRFLILAFRVSAPWAPDRWPLQQSQLQLPSKSRGLPAAPSSGRRCSAWVLNGPPSAPSDIPLDLVDKRCSCFQTFACPQNVCPCPIKTQCNKSLKTFFKSESPHRDRGCIPLLTPNVKKALKTTAN